MSSLIGFQEDQIQEHFSEGLKGNPSLGRLFVGILRYRDETLNPKP